MSAPILARLARSGSLAIQAARTLVGGRVLQVATPATAIDFHGNGFFAQRRMSPAQVRIILEQAAAGSLNYQWELFALMEDSWPRLAKNLAELRRSAARATYSVQPYARRGQKPSADAVERSALVDQALRQWWPKPGTMELSFEDTLFHALDAYGKGISALEVHWQQSEDGILPRCSHILPITRYGWNDTGTELGLVGGFGSKEWQPFPQDHFLVGIWQARTGAPGCTAVLRALAPYWVGITFGWEWLLSNAQIFGVPFRWATFDKTQPQLGPQLRDMLGAMGSTGYAAFPDGTKIEFKEAAQNATGNPQVLIQEMADKACDLLILGQELSGGAQKAGLGGGAANLQEGVRADRLQSTAQWCADLLNYQLVPAILRANWGDTQEAPIITADVDEEPDPLKLAQRDQLLLQAGVELPRAWFYERHGIPMPVAGEAVIAGRPPAAAPGSFGAPSLPAPEPDGDEPDDDEDPAVTAKAAQDESRSTLFRANSLQALTAAQVKAFQPLIKRIVEVNGLPDTAFDNGLQQLRTDLPALAKQCLAADATGQLTKAWQSILGTSLVNGAAAGTLQTTAK